MFYQPSIKSFLPNIIGYQYPRLATSSNLPTILKLVSRATMKEKRSGYHQSDVGSTSDLSCIMKSEVWCGKKVSGAASSSACNTTGELTRTWNYSANISSTTLIVLAGRHPVSLYRQCSKPGSTYSLFLQHSVPASSTKPSR